MIKAIYRWFFPKNEFDEFGNGIGNFIILYRFLYAKNHIPNRCLCVCECGNLVYRTACELKDKENHFCNACVDKRKKMKNKELEELHSFIYEMLESYYDESYKAAYKEIQALPEHERIRANESDPFLLKRIAHFEKEKNDRIDKAWSDYVPPSNPNKLIRVPKVIVSDVVVYWSNFPATFFLDYEKAEKEQDNYTYIDQLSDKEIADLGLEKYKDTINRSTE